MIFFVSFSESVGKRNLEEMPNRGPVYQPTTESYEPGDWRSPSGLLSQTTTSAGRAKCLQWVTLALGVLGESNFLLTFSSRRLEIKKIIFFSFFSRIRIHNFDCLNFVKKKFFFNYVFLLYFKLPCPVLFCLSGVR